MPTLPKKKLHTEFLVEVNKKGQVVRIKSGTWSDIPAFNVMTSGNAAQMWVRHPDGTADVGLYRITYDYDPATRSVHRGAPQLVTAGGNWADDEGAANAMMETARKQAAEQQQRAEEQSKNLPSLPEITGHSPAPSASP